VGIAFLILYLADGMEDESLLRPIYLIGGFGFFLLPVTMGILGGNRLTALVRYWPLLVIPILVFLFFQLRTRNDNE
jgi:hypothetical protein